jgi:uncharacterized protein (TIGR00251 family)
MPDFSDALHEDRHGTVISVEVSAGAKVPLFPAGYNAWRKTLGCRVAAPALEGRANKAVSALISETLGIPGSSVSIQSGATSSQKKVLVQGMSMQEIIDRLQPVS